MLPEWFELSNLFKFISLAFFSSLFNNTKLMIPFFFRHHPKKKITFISWKKKKKKIYQINIYARGEKKREREKIRYNSWLDCCCDEMVVSSFASNLHHLSVLLPYFLQHFFFLGTKMNFLDQIIDQFPHQVVSTGRRTEIFILYSLFSLPIRVILPTNCRIRKNCGEKKKMTNYIYSSIFFFFHIVENLK